MKRWWGMRLGGDLWNPRAAKTKRLEDRTQTRMKSQRPIAPILTSLLATAMLVPPAFTQSGLIKSEFIYETAPFPGCHASTIVETKEGFALAWFGGTAERNPDVCIYV
jgi:hypothetical protein